MSPGQTFEYERRVTFAETDMAGVAQFTAILRWVEEAEAACYRAAGRSLCERREDGALLGWPRVALHAEFLTPVFFDEIVVVTITLGNQGRTSREWRFDIRRKEDSAGVARGAMKSVSCAVAHDGRMTPTPIR